MYKHMSLEVAVAETNKYLPTIVDSDGNSVAEQYRIMGDHGVAVRKKKGIPDNWKGCCSILSDRDEFERTSLERTTDCLSRHTGFPEGVLSRVGHPIGFTKTD